MRDERPSLPGRRIHARPIAACSALLLGLPLGACADGAGEPPTFHRDVAPIVFRRCARCHRPGEAAPFPLLTYRDLQKRARQVVQVTQSRYMPPWLPRRSTWAFADDMRLTDEELETLRRWAEAGTPEGDPRDAPPPPEFVEGWQLGEPDLVIGFPEPFVLRAEGRDVFHNFVLPSPVTETRYVRAVEIRPGDKRYVHHALLRVDRTGAARELDMAEPGPGFEGVDMGPAQMPDGHLVGWLPGRRPVEEDIAWRLRPKDDIVLQLHMLPSGKQELIEAKIGFFFTDEAPEVDPYMLQLGPQLIDIEPGDPEYVLQDSYVLPVDGTLLAIQPHAHYICKVMEGYLQLPGREREELLRIDDWDFNWQDYYRLAEPLFLPAGTELSLRYTYDNSKDNPRNPADEPGRVHYGWRSSEEMCELWFQILPESNEDLQTLGDDYGAKGLRDGVEFLKTIQADSSVALYGMALHKARLGELEEAAAYFRKTLELVPTWAGAHVELATVLARQGDHEGAIADFRAALELEPENAAALCGIGRSLVSTGRSAEARPYLESALEVEPDSADAHFGLADALRDLGDLDGAIEHYRRTIELRPRHAEAHTNLGAVLLSRNQWDEAIEHLRRVVQLLPRHQGAKANLDRALRMRDERRAGPGG